MKHLILIALLFLSVSLFGQEVITQPEPAKFKILEFLGDINMLNVILLAFATFAGGLWYMGREKIRQVGELFMAAYEYTDDKRLSPEERADLFNKFMALIGKYVPTQSEPQQKKGIIKKIFKKG